MSLTNCKQVSLKTGVVVVVCADVVCVYVFVCLLGGGGVLQAYSGEYTIEQQSKL